MSLLLENVNKQWQDRLLDTHKTAQADLRAIEARVRVQKLDTDFENWRIANRAQTALKEAEDKFLHASHAERAAEERAARALERAHLAERRCAEEIEKERTIAAERFAEIQQQAQHMQEMADKRAAELHREAAEAQRRAERVERNAAAQILEIQKDAAKRIAQAEERERQAIEAARAMNKAQCALIAESASNRSKEAAMQIQQLQAQTGERVSLATRRAMTASRRLRGMGPEAAADGDQCYSYRCGDVNCLANEQNQT